MEIRASLPADAHHLADIDGTIESSQYLHVQRDGEQLALTWSLAERKLNRKLIHSNPIDDETRFAITQIMRNIEDGLVLVAEHEDQLVACMVALPQQESGVLRIVDLRVDYDFRRQGLGSALVFQAISEARRRELRAVTARTLTNNHPAARLLLKTGFDLAGLDSQYMSNHDLVKEAVSLFWYVPLD